MDIRKVGFEEVVWMELIQNGTKQHALVLALLSLYLC